jgi:PelA/Pel-15E family pectate lyase
MIIMFRIWVVPTLLLGLLAAVASAAPRTSAGKYFDRPADWFKSAEAAAIAGNILSYQAPEGGWPSNVDTAAKPYDGVEPKALRSTFDNSATSDELRYLARIASATEDKKYAEAFFKGLDYVREAQYDNGGWPQQYPPRNDYSRHITYNDGCTVRLMFFVREVARDEIGIYHFVDATRKTAAMEAWQRGIDCILKTQVRVNGKLTSWCAQHDEATFEPRPARTFELASLSACEVVGILNALMAVENPSPQIIEAVDSAVAWLEEVKIPGIKVEDRPEADTPRGYDRFVVEDPSAEPMWARFYEIGTNKPIFADRDGVKKYRLAEIGIERRTGYQWLKYWPKNTLEKAYPAWKTKVSR